MPGFLRRLFSKRKSAKGAGQADVGKAGTGRKGAKADKGKPATARERAEASEAPLTARLLEIKAQSEKLSNLIDRLIKENKKIGKNGRRLRHIPGIIDELQGEGFGVKETEAALIITMEGDLFNKHIIVPKKEFGVL